MKTTCVLTNEETAIAIANYVKAEYAKRNIKIGKVGPTVKMTEVDGKIATSIEVELL